MFKLSFYPGTLHSEIVEKFEDFVEIEQSFS